MRRDAGLPPHEEVIKLTNNPDYRIRSLLARWGSTKNPVFIWKVIATCAGHKKHPPDDVWFYLTDVARCMTSEEARRSSDLRKILPEIMGFPKKGRPGPGRLLDPDAPS